jgi:hypothetical protein
MAWVVVLTRDMSASCRRAQVILLCIPLDSNDGVYESFGTYGVYDQSRMSTNVNTVYIVLGMRADATEPHLPGKSSMIDEAKLADLCKQ